MAIRRFMNVFFFTLALFHAMIYFYNIMSPIVEFNPSAFKHGVSVADILWAFDHIAYDGLLEYGEDDAKVKYLLIGFDLNANPLEIMYNVIDDDSVNVFHAMKCRNIYKHLL